MIMMVVDASTGEVTARATRCRVGGVRILPPRRSHPGDLRTRSSLHVTGSSGVGPGDVINWSIVDLGGT
jgi:hypothetical protein